MLLNTNRIVKSMIPKIMNCWSKAGCWSKKSPVATAMRTPKTLGCRTYPRQLSQSSGPRKPVSDARPTNPRAVSAARPLNHRPRKEHVAATPYTVQGIHGGHAGRRKRTAVAAPQVIKKARINFCLLYLIRS